MLKIPDSGALDFLAVGALVHRLDPGVIPFPHASQLAIHVSGGEYNCAANLASCFGRRTAIAAAMVSYPIGDMIDRSVRALGVRPFYKRFAHDGVRGPNMATVYSDRGAGMRAPEVFYNRANEAAARLQPGDFDWPAIMRDGVRWLHSGGIFAALSDTTPQVIIEAMQAAKAAGAVVSFDLNYRHKLWQVAGGADSAHATLRSIVSNVDVLVGNEEDLQQGLGIAGPAAKRGVKARPARVPADDRPRERRVPRHLRGGHHAARGALRQPPRLERGGLGGRRDGHRAHVSARRVRPDRRRGRLRRRLLLTA